MASSAECWFHSYNPKLQLYRLHVSQIMNILLRRWQWHGRRSNGVVSIRVCIKENISIWCPCVKPSILWWILALQKIHCLWVRFRIVLRNWTPHFSRDLCGVHCKNRGRIHLRRSTVIQPSTKQSQPRQSCDCNMRRYREFWGMQLSIVTTPWLSK
jgi:hypothetical protein